MVITHPYLILKGGAERVVLKIAQHYQAKIYVIEYDKAKTFPEFSDLDIELVNSKVPFSSMLPYRASQGMRAGYAFYNFKIKEDYDLLNSHTSPSEWIRNKNSPLLWYCHTPIREVYDLYQMRMKNRSGREKLLYVAFTNAYKFLASGVIKNVESIATNSNNTNARIKKYLGRDDAVVINPGIDYEEFYNNGTEKYFLYPSRYYINKRQDYVIDAFAKFQKKTKRTDYKLILPGSISKDKEHLDYFERLKKKNVPNVIFKLNVSDKEMKELYSKATAVMNASVNEDFGIVTLEGMASSKPVIAVNEGGFKETVSNEVTGFLVDSVDEMAERMRYIVEHPKLSEQMGKEARKVIETKYSWESFFEKFDKLAKKTLKKAQA